ncbi:MULTISPECIES: carbohydrate ABC transporter permease [Bifidobacterium]|uniref:carbohydrate ABC transporter permease n=1 Tax=Bifidobacterium TaxID=1678 RepID=UPI0018DCBCAB|nr:MULTISPECIES: carbohydrate ABC transporter permease [Bifidobacterium]MBI0048042.1 carbohydrate ABC transporter permease [Bifidobacterium choladohabitans]MBI0090166.1 carbohydrate ABC transporter permease [Bifidobacterium choladohabitans]MBI0125673.1 carbohydrate ABC transporter permease [Bifidobacterium choladohabitans]MBI0127242.1 carbohydrate ABC transporter permease [Bifidobacterium sp. W8103]MBI0137830.1 carbohydrate ABC transporter permease [Bifidobacterium sp. W8105]
MKSGHSKVTVGKVIQYLVLILVFILLVGPFVWELSLSFKGKGDNVYAVPPYIIPKTPTWNNYISVFRQVPVFRYMLNTVIVAILSIGGNVIFSTMAGYALGRLKWRGRNLLFTIFMGTMVIPVEGVVISQFLIVRSVGLQNTLLAVALPGMVGAVNILLMTNAFRGIPDELEEAAEVDGANLWQRFYRICVPQVKGTMTVVGIFAFVGAWNDFLWPLIVISDESNYTLTLGMNRLKGMFISDPRLIAAGALVSLIPILVFFACFQRYFFRGLEQGGIKE